MIPESIPAEEYGALVVRDALTGVGKGLEILWTPLRVSSWDLSCNKYFPVSQFVSSSSTEAITSAESSTHWKSREVHDLVNHCACILYARLLVKLASGIESDSNDPSLLNNSSRICIAHSRALWVHMKTSQLLGIIKHARWQDAPTSIHVSCLGEHVRWRILALPITIKTFRVLGEYVGGFKA